MTLKAYRLNEYEIYAGVDLEDAIKAAMKATGCTREETLDEMYGPDYEVPGSMPLGVEDEPDVTTTVGELLDGLHGPGLLCSCE